MNKISTYLFVLMALFGTAQAQEINHSEVWETAYKKAKVATFYSATYANGWEELHIAKAYTDSASKVLEDIIKEDSSFIDKRSLIRSLRGELEISQSIAQDNVNYRYPALSVMLGTHDDFVIKDDAEELLIESLLEEVITQNDPINKGKIVDNMDFIVLQIQPYDETHFTVANDFFGHTGHYVVRFHEFVEILGEEGFERFKTDELTLEDWDKIYDTYGIDKLLHFKIVDQDPELPGLFYKGIFLNIAVKGEFPRYVSYYEGYKFDKITSFSNGVLVSIMNFLVTLLALFFMLGLKFSSKRGRGIRIGKYSIYLFVNWDVAKETIVIGTVSFISVYLAQYLGNQFAPDVNAFYQETAVKTWVLYESVVPFLASVLLTYLVMFKLPNFIVNNTVGYSRILFASWMAQLNLLSFYKYHADILPGHILGYVEFIPVLGLVFISFYIGTVLNRIFKGEKVTYKGYVLLAISVIVAFLCFWLELKESLGLANYIYLGLAVPCLLFLYSPKIIGSSFKSMGELESEEAGQGLSNPLKWYTKGVNVLSIQEQLLAFIDSEDLSKRAFLINGKSGAGKTRLLNETIKQIISDGRNYRWFQGDCNQVLEGSAPMYEPFYEAFSLNGEQIEINKPLEDRKLPQGFFTDRSQLSKAFGKVLNQAGAVAPVDLAGLLSVEDETSRSVSEIVSELLDSLISRYVDEDQSKVVLVIDDFHWIDDSSFDLIKALVQATRDRSKYSQYFKFIFTISTDQDNGAIPALERLNEVMVSDSSNMVGNALIACELVVEKGVDFVDQVLSDNKFKLNSSVDIDFRFGPLIKGHMQYMVNRPNITFMPGDFLGYLEALEQRQYIKFDGDVIRLAQEPKEDEIGLQDSRKSVLKSDYESLNPDQKSLLESAAIIGYKFDAELLAKIWNRDLLVVLNELEQLEGSFVFDLSQEDNIYSFVSKTMYRVILESANKKKDELQSRQLIIEYQKRIIKSIIEFSDTSYVESLDLDLLISASERCFKYSHVKYIKENAAVIVLYACKQLAVKGKNQQSIQYLKRLYRDYSDFNQKEITLIGEILIELTKADRSISRFEFLKEKDDQSSRFIDYIFVRARQLSDPGIDYEQNAFAMISVVIMGGVMHEIREASKEHSGLNISNFLDTLDASMIDNEFAQRMVNRYNRIQALISNSQLQNERAISRISFYSHIAKNSDYRGLPNLFKNAMTSGYSNLAGEIGREIYLNSEFEYGTKLKFLYGSLEILAGGNVTLEKIEESIVDKFNVDKTIEKLIKAKNLSSKEAVDFNFLLSRFREHFWEFKDFDYVLFLCEISMELSRKLNNGQGITQAYSYEGAALHQMGRFEDSQSIYQKHFEHVIRTSRKITDFLYPLEGLLRNCKKIGDLEPYNNAKEELYEHMIIMERAAIEKQLEYSLFDRSSAFSRLLEDVPEPEYLEDEHQEEDDPDQVSFDIIGILLTMAAADGVIDEYEIYDLKEAGIAISHSLNLSRKVVTERIEEELEKAMKRTQQEGELHYKQSCQNVIDKKSLGFFESVVQLCTDMAMANKVLHPAEARLLEISRTFLAED